MQHEPTVPNDTMHCGAGGSGGIQVPFALKPHVLEAASTQQPTGAAGAHAVISRPSVHCLVPQVSPLLAPAAPVVAAPPAPAVVGAVLPPTAARPAALTVLPAAALLPAAPAGRPLTPGEPAVTPVAIAAMPVFSGVLLHALARPIADATTQTRVFMFQPAARRVQSPCTALAHPRHAKSENRSGAESR